MRLSLQSRRHKLNYKLGLSNCQLLGQLTEQEVLQTFCLSDLQYYHYHLQDLSSLIVQHPQNCGVDIAAQSTDPIIAKLKVPVCNSICDVETADSASLLLNDVAMNDEDAHFEDEVNELPASSVQELPHIKDCAVQLATIARGSLFPDKVAATCNLKVAKADVTLPTPNNQPRSLALEKCGSNNA